MTNKTNIKANVITTIITKLNADINKQPHFIELTKVELATIYIYLEIEELYKSINDYNEKRLEFLNEQDEILSLTNNLEELVGAVLPKELKVLHKINKNLQISAKKYLEIKISTDDNSLFDLADLILLQTLKEKIKVNGYGFEEKIKRQMHFILSTYDGVTGYKSINDISKTSDKKTIQKAIRLIESAESDKVLTLLNGLECLNKEYEGQKKIFSDVYAKNKKNSSQIETYRKAVSKELKKIRESVETMRWNMITINENLEALIEDNDKVKLRETLNLLKKYNTFLLEPVLDKNDAFIKDVEAARNNFKVTYQFFVEDEIHGSGSVLKKSTDKIDEVIG